MNTSVSDSDAEDMSLSHTTICHACLALQLFSLLLITSHGFLSCIRNFWYILGWNFCCKEEVRYIDDMWFVNSHKFSKQNYHKRCFALAWIKQHLMIHLFIN